MPKISGKVSRSPRNLSSCTQIGIHIVLVLNKHEVIAFLNVLFSEPFTKEVEERKMIISYCTKVYEKSEMSE